MPVKPEIVIANAAHIPVIAAHVRLADRDELYASAMVSPQEALEQSFSISKMAWTGLIDGVPVCMFGVAPVSVLSTVGRPWMIGTDHLDRHPFVFLRRCRGCVETMRMCFDRLENHVDARNIRAIQWLTWLGFELDKPEPRGPFGLPFIRFGMRGM